MDDFDRIKAAFLKDFLVPDPQFVTFEVVRPDVLPPDPNHPVIQGEVVYE